MKKLFTAAILLVVIGVADAAIRVYGPQGPAGHSSCTGVNANKDLDGDGKPGATDTGCTAGAYDQFSAVEGGYAAYFEDAFLDANLEIVADTASPSGNSIQVKSTSRQGWGNARVCGNFAAGDYYLKVFGTVPVSPTIIYIDDSPLGTKPATTKRTAVTGLISSGEWTSAALQRGFNLTTGAHSETDYKITANGNHCVDLRIYQGTKLATIFASTNSTAAPAHPSSGPTPAYTVYLKGVGNTITIDGVGNEGVWAHADGAPAVPWLGSTSSNDTSATVQFLRDGPTIYFLAKANDTDISCTSTGFDQNNTWNGCDHWEFLFHNSQVATLSGDTVKFDIDVNENVYDATYPATVESSTADMTNVSVNCTVVANTSKVCEGKFDLPYTPTDDIIVLANVLHSDYDAAAFTSFSFGVAGSFNSLANARYLKWSSTALDTLTTPDVTAPSFTAFSSGTPAATSTSLSVTVDEAASCTIKYGTSSAAYGSYPNTLGTFSTVQSGANHVASSGITGLTASTNYFWRAQCTDAAANAATSNEQTFTTAAAASAACVYFELTSTWCASTGATLADRRVTWANKQTNSDNIVAYVGSTVNGGVLMQGSATSGGGGQYPVLCHSSNSDPLVNVAVGNPLTGNWQADGWFTGLRIPDSCNPYQLNPSDSDRHLVLLNSDEPNFVWEFYKMKFVSVGNWSASRGRRWCRVAANCTGGDGLGRGVLYPRPSNDGNSLTAACGASPSKTFGMVTKAELDAGEIKHAIIMIAPRLYNPSYTPLWPCNYSGQTHAGGTNSAKVGHRFMLDPDLNVDALSIGTHAKIILKAMQNYGAIVVDQTCSSCNVTIGQTESRDWTGYDFSRTGIGPIIAANMRVIKCIASFAGECPTGE